MLIDLICPVALPIFRAILVQAHVHDVDGVLHAIFMLFYLTFAGGVLFALFLYLMIPVVRDFFRLLRVAFQDRGN